MSDTLRLRSPAVNGGLALFIAATLAFGLIAWDRATTPIVQVR